VKNKQKKPKLPRSRAAQALADPRHRQRVIPDKRRKSALKSMLTDIAEETGTPKKRRS